MPQGNNPLQTRLLSVIIPAYNQENTIVRDIHNIEKTLQALDENYEIIVVIDGAGDRTYERAKKLRSSKIKIFQFTENKGKGEAVRFGMLQAKGDIIGFIDAGMDIHPSGLSMLLNHMEWYDADIIVGSKLHPVSMVSYPLWRKILSRGYRLLTRLMFGFKVRDTQVGLKFFKRRVVRSVFPRLLVKSFAFDVEMLAVAYQLGYHRIYEAPVQINFRSKKSSITSKSLWKIIYFMLWDTAAVFYRLRILNYYRQKKISEIHSPTVRAVTLNRA
jgi:glycosyltransferase involved in cell wall biosynthesis